MKAVLTHDFEDATVEEIERPSPGEDEVLLEVNQLQLSVTECWMYQGHLDIAPSLQERMDDDGALAFGHEFCATVAELGDGVEEFEVGDRVYAPGKITCGECVYCKNDWKTLCKNQETFGLGEYPGAAAEYFVAPTEPLATVPDGVSDQEAAALQPLSDALGRVHDAGITTGDVVAVIGAGVMGNQCGQLSQVLGASETFAIDIDPNKIELAESLGMTGIDASEVDPVEEVLDRTNGIGPDVVFSAVGGNQSNATSGDDPRAQALQMVRKGGTIVQVGIIFSEEMTFEPGAMMRSSVDIVNPVSYGGIRETGPNRTAGDYAAQLVASDRVAIDHFTDIELDGLESFDEMIEITSNKEEYDTLGPAQITL